MCSFKKKLFLLIFYLSPLAVMAQNRDDSISQSRKIQKIQEITVVARPFKEIIPAQKLDGSKLAQLNSYSVADALRYFAGVQLKDYGGIGGLKTVNIQSMGSNHIGVFYDGIELGNAQNGVVDLGKYSLDNVEEITLYNGQKSTIFQSAKDYASSATIYIKSKRPHFEGSKKTNLTVSYNAGSIQLINPSFRLEQKLSNELNMSISSEYIKSNGEYKFRYTKYQPNGQIAYDTTAIRKGGDIDAFRVENSFYGKIKDGVWDTKLYYYNSDRGLPGAILANNFEQGQRLYDKDFFGQASMRRNITEKYKFEARIKYAYDYTSYVDAGISNYYQQELYASLVNMYNITRQWDVSVATDFQWNKLDANLYNFAYPQRYTGLIALASSLDFGQLKAQTSLLASYVDDNTKTTNAAAPLRSEYTPSIFVGYKPFDDYNFTLRTFYKRIFRMPTFNDLYYTTVGSANLKPEFTNQYDLGFTYHVDLNKGFVEGLNIQTDAYYIEQTNKIIASPTASLFRWTMINMGKIKTRGIDFVAGFYGHMNELKYNARMTYSYTKAQDFSNPNGSTYKDQIPYTPLNSGSAIIGVTYKTWGFNYSFIYTGGRYNGSENNISANYLQPWYTTDLALNKMLQYRKMKIKAAIEVNNIFNQYYDVVANYPMPGRNFKLRITISL